MFVSVCLIDNLILDFCYSNLTRETGGFELAWNIPLHYNLVVHFNNMSSSHNINTDDSENVVTPKYYDIEELQNLKITHKNKSFSLFYINVYSLSKNFDDFQHLFSCTNKNVEIIAVTETRIMKNISITNNLAIRNYSFEFTRTAESSAGGTLLSTANHLSYKPRQDLHICKKYKMGSTLIEIINSSKSNIVVGCVYKHTSASLTDLANNYLNNILDEVSKEQKAVFLLGDFNVNLLNYNDHNPTNEFFDSVESNSFLSYILQPTRKIGIQKH